MPVENATFSLLRQSDATSREARLAVQHGLSSDTPVLASTMDNLERFAQELRCGQLLPIGSVEYVRKAMALAGIAEPQNMSYPAVLQAHLHRDLFRLRAGSVLGRWFVKPTTTKAFTGFVFDTLSSPDRLSAHDRLQYDAFMAVPSNDPVWISEPVHWLCEHRYYVADGVVLGSGRYDDGADDAPVPDPLVIDSMVGAMAGCANAGTPCAYSLDAGVLSTGATALVECNDAWALGYYSGTLSASDYFSMLWSRWAQMLSARP